MAGDYFSLSPTVNSTYVLLCHAKISSYLKIASGVVIGLEN